MGNETKFSGLSYKVISAEMPLETFVLSNGIRLIHQQTDSPVAYCALMMGVGSRDELEDEFGVAHLVEHLLFKETQKRKAHHIFNYIENVGGELNAYTTKEDTCIHAAFLSDYYARALELFSDIVFHHKISDKTLEIEKRVVIDEINSCKDNPVESIFDAFDELLFGAHPLGHNLLGSVRSIKKANKVSVEQFVARTYCTEQMVLSSVGKISLQKLIYYAEKYLGQVPLKTKDMDVRVIPEINPSFIKNISKNNHQSHCIIGTSCDSVDRKFRLAMTMLANFLGGPGMSTRLNMSLRERNGWVYHVEASYTPYSDIGLFAVYFGTDKNNLEKCIGQIKKEFATLKLKPMTVMQLKRLQQQVVGQLAIASDNGDAKMLSAGKSLLMYNRVDTLSEIFEQVDQMQASYLQEVANEVFDNLSLLVYQ